MPGVAKSTFMAIRLGSDIPLSRQFLLSILLCTLLPLPNYAQTSFPTTDDRWREAGLPYRRIYSATEYGGDQQNWDIVQDRRGVMYFANQNCLLEYDGVTWRQIYTGDRLSVRSVAIDSSGRIWMGAALEIGYFSPDAIGNLQYASLLPHVPSHIREAADYWRAAVTEMTIYMQTRNFLLRFDPSSNALTTISSESGFDKFIMFGNTLYIRKNGVGLMRMQGDSLRLIPGGERFADVGVSALLPFTDSAPAPDAASEEFTDRTSEIHSGAPRSSFLAVTRAHGLFLYDGVSFQPFITEADAMLRQANVVSGAALTDGSYALGTDKSGVVVIGRHGQQLLTLNLTTGLPGNSVYCMYVDSQGGLWLGTNRGLVRVEFPSPLSRHRSSLAFRNGINLILRHQDTIYLATSEGLYKMVTGVRSGAPAAFKLIPTPGQKIMFGHMASVGDRLFAATASSGLYQIKDDRVERMQDGGRVDVSRVYFMRSRYNLNRIYLGVATGLGFLELRNGTWQLTGQIPNFHENVNEIAEESPDVLWLTSRLGKAFRVELPSLHLSPPSGFLSAQIERFDEAHGLSKGWIRVLSVNGKVLFATHKGLRRFDPASRTFQLEASFGNFFADSTWNTGGAFFYDDDRGRMWTSRFYHNKTEAGVAIPEPNGDYTWYTEPFKRFADFGEIWNFYIDEKYQGVYWFGGADGAIRYDETIAKDYSAGYPALIRRVIVNGDSVIYGGAYADPASMMNAPSLSFANNTIRIEYAAPYYDNEAANQYQFFMEDFEDGWSDWTHETFVDYRHLPEGRYRFRVRARNIYQNLGGEAAFTLEILPPWYRTWWSYLLYGLMALGALYGIRRYEMNRQQHKHQAELEHVQTEKLKELDKLKSDFFANISHEFRTPLTLILGPAEQLMEKQTGEDKRMLSLIRRNAQRLLRLVNQLLDLSKLEHGGLSLQAAPGDFIAFLKGLVMSFESLAERKGIDLQFAASVAQGLTESYFDHDKIEAIFTNLLSNAFKFTPEGGRVSVQLSVVSNQFSVNSNQLQQKPLNTDHWLLNTDHWTLITVQDTGEGIPAEQLPHIFDRFYQVDTSSRRVHGGAGIGLALVKELVELHYGSITVTSEAGVGTTFTVCLPLGKAHLKPEEIVVAASSSQSSVFSDQYSEDDMFVQPDMIDDQEQTPDRPIILIVEDNADVRVHIRMQLGTDYAIIEAEDGEAGIARAIETTPDLVISDVMMPRKDGYEVCRALKTDERTSHIPVILLTAKAGEKEKLAGFETGADAYVLKPFRQQELAARVRNLIALRRKLREKYSTATVIKPSEVEATSMDRDFLKRVIAVIEANMTEEQFHAEALAREAAMSLSQLNRKLNALIGQPAGHLIRSLRLQRAADLLAKKSGTVAEICYAVGFGDQANFTRSFKKQFGYSPLEYQKRHQG